MEISKRDYFAGLAMQALIAEGHEPKTVAIDAYQYAEAMEAHEEGLREAYDKRIAERLKLSTSGWRCNYGDLNSRAVLKCGKCHMTNPEKF